MRSVAAVVYCVFVFAVCSPAAFAAPATPIPARGTVTMVDLGAKACIPCKMMVPVMEWAQKQYGDRAAIVFIDVWEHPDQKEAFGLRAIPTQIFYDRNGKEVYRHEGFLDKKPLAEMLDTLLAQ